MEPIDLTLKELLEKEDIGGPGIRTKDINAEGELVVKNIKTVDPEKRRNLLAKLCNKTICLSPKSPR